MHIRARVDEEYARTLEEQWIESIDSTGIGSPSTDSNAVLQGVLLGFFMPFLPFFYFASPKLPVFWSSGESVESLGSVVFSYVDLPYARSGDRRSYQL